MTPPKTPPSAPNNPPENTELTFETTFFKDLRDKLQSDMEHEKLRDMIQESLRNLQESIAQNPVLNKSEKKGEKESFLQKVETQISSFGESPFESSDQILTALKAVENDLLLAGDFVKDELEAKVEKIKTSLEKESPPALESPESLESIRNSKLYKSVIENFSHKKEDENLSLPEKVSAQKLFHVFIAFAHSKNSEKVFDFSDKDAGKESFKTFLGIDKKESDLFDSFIDDLYNKIPLESGISTSEQEEKERQDKTLASLVLEKKNGEYQLIPQSKQAENKAVEETEAKQELTEKAINHLSKGVDSESWNTLVQNTKSYNDSVSSELNSGGFLAGIMRIVLNLVGMDLDQVVKTNTTLGTIARQLAGVSLPPQNTNPLNDEKITDTIDEEFITGVIHALDSPKFRDRAELDHIDNPDIKSLVSPLMSAYSDIFIVGGYTKSRTNPPQISFKLRAGSKASLTTIFAFLTPSNSEQALRSMQSELGDRVGSAGDAFKGVVNFANEYGQEGGVLESIFPSSDKLIKGIPEFDAIKKKLYSRDSSKKTHPIDTVSLNPNADGTITVSFLGEKKQKKKPKPSSSSAPNPPTSPTPPKQPTPPSPPIPPLPPQQ